LTGSASFWLAGSVLRCSGGARVRARFVHCRADMHCPSLNIFGTFFPSWMLCALLGIVGAVAALKLLAALRIDREIGPRLVVYPCIALSVTSVLWLAFYGH
jgi:hypothetical protein